MNRLNLKLLKRAFVLARPYWSSQDKWKASGMIVLLILLLVGDTEFNILFNDQSGEFTSALAARDAPRFWHSIRNFFGLLLVAVPIYAYYYYVRDKLALNWRRWLTDQFLGRYFKNRGYYKLLAKPDIDNPDQRIAEDIDSFTQRSLTFLLLFAGGVIQCIGFSRVLWTISSHLLLFVLLYAVLVTFGMFRIFGEKMVSLNFQQRRREADFRFGLIRIRENAEAIALYHGEQQEKDHLNRLFGRLFANAARLINWTMRLNFLKYGNSLLTTVLPTLIIAPRVLSGELEVGRIVQATGAFSAILTALTLFVDNLEGLSRFAAGIGRLEGLNRGMAPASQQNAKGSKIVTQAAEEVGFENVTLNTPNNERTLIKGLNLSIPPGEGLMIVGSSGLGKSSLLRVMAGLWDAGEGTLMRPKAEDMLFLPQQPYMVLGSLRAQLSYPNLEHKLVDDELREVLKLVNLGNLVERCGGMDEDFDFEKILSAGERQRLAFARVLLNRPRYALLDEATSALDRDNENVLYSRLAGTPTTVVSVSHHPQLVKYHSQVLELKPDGVWELHPAKKFRFSEELV